MKKVFIITLSILSFSHTVLAVNINDNIEIKYRWYKETISDGFYYPKKSKLPDYLEDKNNIKYSNYTEWNEDYCNYSKENYLIEEKEITTYEKLVKTKYVKMLPMNPNDCLDTNCFSEILVFSGKNSIGYKVIQNTPDCKTLELYDAIDIDDLWFHVNTNINYFIYTTDDINKPFSNLGYGLNPTYKIIIPFSNWILAHARYSNEQTEDNLSPSPFIKNIQRKKVCRVREKNTYRYKIEKEYYDDNYYSYIEGYLPDINDYSITYNSSNYSDENNQDINTKIEYIYINNEEEVLPNIENKTIQNTNEKQVIYKTEYTPKIPYKILIIILLLFIIIIIESIIILAKKVD